MKIGILTFHRAENYGAVLQAYALQEKIKQLGFDAYIVDYNPYYLARFYKLIPPLRGSIINKCKTLISTLLVLIKKQKRAHKFASFRNEYLRLTPEYHADAIPDLLDVYVFGSDQIWNPEIAGAFDGHYFGDFVEGVGKRISYAASMGAKEPDREQINQLKQLLQGFTAISVREQKTEKFLKGIITQEVTTVIDPVLLQTKYFWESKSKFSGPSERYILIYDVVPQISSHKIAREAAKLLGINIIEISTPHYKNGSNIIDCASPEEFLGWIAHAELVVTSSFHGTAFSVLFERKLWVTLLHDDRDYRVLTLLEGVDLQDRIIANLTEIPDDLNKEIDYSIVNKHLTSMRSAAELFLTESITQYSKS